MQLERADVGNYYFGFLDFLDNEAEIFEEVSTLREYLDLTKRKYDKSRLSARKSAESSSFLNTPGSSCSICVLKTTTKDIPACQNPNCNEKLSLKECSRTAKGKEENS